MVQIQKEKLSKRQQAQRLVRIAGVLLATLCVAKVHYEYGHGEVVGGHLDEIHMVRRASEASSHEQHPLLLSYEKPTRQFQRNKFTLDKFVVNGVNLAAYGFEDTTKASSSILSEKYQLFDNFHVGDRVTGKEDWIDMLHYHRDLPHSSLIFYMDKVSQKRYMKAMGYPMPEAKVLHYKHELGIPMQEEAEERAAEEMVVSRILPKDSSYVVKPTHKSSSSGVWLVRYDEETREQKMGYSGKPTDQDFDGKQIAQRVVQDLHVTAADFESLALKHAKPGFVVEERYSAFDSDTKAAYEFKTFTIWGRVYFGYLKRGNGDYIGLVYRDGTTMDCQHHNTDWERVPEWLQWDKVVEVAEHLGRNKDQFRVDVFVGLPSGSPELEKGDPSVMRIAVSETEFHPTSSFKDKEILEEASRLWMAGYMMKIYDLVPNTEVPPAFLEKGYFSEPDAKRYGAEAAEKSWTSRMVKVS